MGGKKIMSIFQAILATLWIPSGIVQGFIGIVLFKLGMIS